METADCFRARIDAMINLSDPLAVLASRLPWDLIEASLAATFERRDRAGQVLEGQDMFGPTLVLEGAGSSNAGRPKLPIRLMASLLYLKHSFNLSDEAVAARWSENVLWQFFSGLAYYEHRLPCDPTQIGRFRRDLGEEGLEHLLKATINTAVAIEAVKPKDLERVIVDTTVQEKAIAHPVDSRLLSNSTPQGGQRCQARRHPAQADLCQRGQGVAAPRWWLRARQAVPSSEESGQASADHSWRRHA
jgi:IS5 family transposase